MESDKTQMKIFDEFEIIGGIIPNLVGLAFFCGLIIYFDQTRKARINPLIHSDIATPITVTIDLKRMEVIEHQNKLLMQWATR